MLFGLKTVTVGLRLEDYRRDPEENMQFLMCDLFACVRKARKHVN